ncbi:MAG: carboxypeptidase regulatory-like domain-containing protein, partial [Pyrinomonadaceae bacterium]
RTFTSMTADVLNANFIAYDALTRNLRVANGYTVPGQAVTVPIVLTAMGNEAKADFRLTYDAARLNTPTVACGAASGAACTIVLDTATAGVIGISVDPVTATYASGLKEVVTITFNTTATTASNTPLVFATTGNLTTDTSGNPLQTTYTNGFVVFQHGLEGDAASRFTGDGLYRPTDIEVTRVLVAGGAANGAYNEFQRADSAPYGTGGDGVLDAIDVQQQINYVAGLAAAQTAGGPVQPLPAPPPFARKIGAYSSVDRVKRAVRVVSATAGAGHKVSVFIEMDAQGDETAASFTLNFDPMKLTNPVVSLGADAAGANLTANTTRASEGRVMMLVDSAVTTAASMRLITVTFDVATDAVTGKTAITFGSDPTPASISSAEAKRLDARYEDGHIMISGATASSIQISGRVQTEDGRGLRNATVTLTDSSGVSRSVVTSTFGRYTFDDVAAGQTYRISVTSKRYRFAAKMIQPIDNLVGADFTAQE